MQTLNTRNHDASRTQRISFSRGARPARLLRTPRSTFRRAFTLVEMLMVIVIIGVLIGLALPMMMGARTKANEARIVAEIKALESAIAAFKAKYGVEPPSRFTLYLTQPGWQADPTNRAIVRQIWGSFDFNMGAGSGVAYPAFWWNGTTGIATQVNIGGTSYPALQMNGSECLLFFLGGVIDVAGQGQVPTGFSTNKQYPFAPRTANPNREGPFFNGFSDAGRIKDNLGNNGINEWYDYVPSQQLPYLYLSSYSGRAYVPTEIPVDLSGNFLLHDLYRVSSTAVSPPASPLSAAAGTSAAINGIPNSNPQNPQTCQIISPGYDMVFGFGGVFNPNLINSGLQPLGGQFPDGDNLTNFNSGRLKP